MIVVVNADQDTTTAIYRLVKKREDFVIVADETQELLDCALKDDTEDKMPQLIRDECLTCISPLLLEMSTMRPLEPIKVVDDETDDAIHAQHATETERLVLGDNHWHLAKMARQIAASIAPEAIRDAFDPRSLVHIKKHIVGGGVDSTQLYDGAALSGKVFTPPDWSPPSGRDLKVLLIDVPIEFRRDQTRLESLDDLLMQEAEWLSHCCARLVTRHPDVVFMAQSISHYAKQLLLKTGSVRVVTNVKPSALKRLQAATMGEVISTIEEIRTAKMGRTPHMSCLVQIGTEALIMVRSLLPGRQFSVLIKGANAAVLSSIQKCLAHLVLQAYQALCERAYFATRSRGRLDLAQHQQRHKECTCSSTTGGFTGRMLHSTKREVKLLDRAHLGDLSPMISIEPLAIDNAQIERRTDRTEHLLNNLQQSQQGQTKRHRFAIDPPLATEPHPFTATNTVLNEPDAEVAAADFRSRGSYPIVDHDQIRHNEEIEHGEMMASSYNGTLDKIYEYALAYSSYCLGREDTLLCAEPSVVPLVPYSSQDISLRQFIVQLGHGDLCAHCALPNRLHIRRMVYGGRALHVMFITSRAKLAEGEFITWGADQSRPSRVSPLLATMSVAAFLRLLLAPGTPDTIKTDMIRQTHYFATGHIICAIKPFPLATLSVESPTAQLTRDVERLWSLEPVRTELEELQTNGYALLEQIEKTQEKDEEFFDQAKGQFREAIEVVLVKYGEIRTKEMIEWGVLCDMYNQLGHLGQAVATINDKWLEIMKRVVHRQGGDETEEEIASEIVTDLPEIISTPLNYVNNLLHANKLSHERHFFPNDNSLLVFPIREDEPTSIYAHALANEQLLKASGDTSGAMVMALDAFLTCKIYHYAAFKRLRAAVGLGNDKDYITSIMRCTAWEAKGGKSGAKFYKSHDCRFVIKHIGAKEVKTIVEKGELYIDYMVNRSEKPSCLAKILGVFQVQMKQNETIKSHYIIMEDIFYGKTISKTYDLKGSRRNRMSKEEHIFLDSNYINQMRDHPVYIDKASQLSMLLFSIRIKFKTNFKVLHNAIYNDADFLSSHSIIDYSLLVGVDEENDKLYIGIIDFIRTYTWDKVI